MGREMYRCTFCNLCTRKSKVVEFKSNFLQKQDSFCQSYNAAIILQDQREARTANCVLVLPIDVIRHLKWWSVVQKQASSGMLAVRSSVNSFVA